MSSYFCLPTDLFNKLDTVWKWNNELMWNKSVSKATQNNTGTHPAACCTYSPTTKTPASLRKRNTLPWRPSSSRHTHSPGVITLVQISDLCLREWASFWELWSPNTSVVQSGTEESPTNDPVSHLDSSLFSAGNKGWTLNLQGELSENDKCLHQTRSQNQH